MKTVKKIEFISYIGLDNGYVNNQLGEHASTMELIRNDQGDYYIEWDIESLGETEYMDLEIKGMHVLGYSGVFELPEQAVELLESCGFDCSEVK